MFSSLLYIKLKDTIVLPSMLTRKRCKFVFMYMLQITTLVHYRREDIEIFVVVIGMTLTVLLSTICYIIGCKMYLKRRT